LKREEASCISEGSQVTCDLIPLAVLKPDKYYALYRIENVVTCDLIPLAVLKHDAE